MPPTGPEDGILIRRNPRARRLSLRIDAHDRRAVLTAPKTASKAAISAFLSSQRDWIDRHLAALPSAVLLTDGAVLPLRGEPHRLCHLAEAPRRPVADSGRILLGGPANHVDRRLRQWLRAEAARDIGAAVAFHAAALGTNPGRIRLKEMKSRWGSCSIDGDLSFNWRLILAPPFVLDYVAAHEVAHLLVHDHSPRFWALVAGRTTRMAEARRWLRHEGAGLFRYAPRPAAASRS